MQDEFVYLHILRCVLLFEEYLLYSKNEGGGEPEVCYE